MEKGRGSSILMIMELATHYENNYKTHSSFLDFGLLFSCLLKIWVGSLVAKFSLFPFPFPFFVVLKCWDLLFKGEELHMLNSIRSLLADSHSTKTVQKEKCFWKRKS